MATAIPTTEVLANLVTGVTQTMFGLAFVLEAGPAQPWSGEPDWYTVVLPIRGKRPITVAIAADARAATVLGSHMFSCKPDKVDVSMHEDSLAELANIVAGRVKAAMHLDQALGLPEVVHAPARGRLAMGPWHEATLTAGTHRALVWVAVSEGNI